jgi:flagellin
MALTVSNNSTVQVASYYLGKNQRALQSSIKKLASGKKLVDPATDPGTMSVAMKVRASVNRLSGAQNNVRNALGFLEVQDGLLETAGRIVMRMSELKGYSTSDPMKSEQDIASYNNEFKDLQVQLYQISQMDFNGASLFANHRTDGDDELLDGSTAYPTGGSTLTEAKFAAQNQAVSMDNTLSIPTSSKGSEGTQVSISRSLLLSALSVRTNTENTISTGVLYSSALTINKAYNSSAGVSGTASIYTFAVENSADALSLGQVSTGVFQAVIENVVFLRAQNGGQLSRLNFAAESLSIQETNMRSALGRIEDVDMAEEASNLAKYSILLQASAAMVAQANSTNDVALMLLRV